MTESTGRSPWVKIVYLLLTVAAGFVIVGPLIGFLISIPFYNGSVLDLAERMTGNVTDPALKVPIYIMQAGATLIGLIVLPSLQYRAMERKSVLALQEPQPFFPLRFAFAALIVVSFTVVNSVFIEWNATVNLPDFLKGFETWAREKEDLAAEITRFLTTFSSPGEFLLAFVVIAVLPGIGEELVFRGMLQNQLHAATKNIHVAIWVAAVLFSSIHLQFFGFVPRVLLGALFGYLYHWSGNLWIAMFAHFVNNGFMVVMMYLNQLHVVEMDVESTESAPWPAVLIFTILTFVLLAYFRRVGHGKNTIQ